MDLREMGEPFEKKYIQFSKEEIEQIAQTYHNWQTNGDYQNTAEYCYSATTEEIRAKDYSLVPSKYIEFVNRDENVDYDEKMAGLQQDLIGLLKEEQQSNKDLLKVFEKLGYNLV